MAIDDVQSAIRSVMRQNRDELLNRGTSSTHQIHGKVGDIEYTIGMNNGRVGQFYSN